MANDKNKHVSDKDANIKGERDEDKVYVEGQNRHMIERTRTDKKNPLIWIIPIILILMILPLVIHLFTGNGSEEGDTTPSTPGDTEETDDTQEGGTQSDSEDEAPVSGEEAEDGEGSGEGSSEEDTTEENTAEEDTTEESEEDQSAGGEEEPSEPDTSESN